MRKSPQGFDAQALKNHQPPDCNQQRPMKHANLLITLIIGVAVLLPFSARADSAAEIERDVAQGMKRLLDSNPSARKLAKTARAVLIFPKIFKASFVFGGQYGKGAMIERGYTVGYYNTAAASFGFEAGGTEFGYALFFMDDESLSYLKRSKGWEIGVGPTVVLVDEGIAKSISSTTLQRGVYAYFFDQKGLMAGAGIQGSKITRIHPR
jgi:lipid-binding SYLF domain-containing protein